MLQGTVVEYHREYCWVRLEDGGKEVVAKPRSRLEFVQQYDERDFDRDGKPRFSQQLAVGDHVIVDEPSTGHFVIEEILPRLTWLMRKGTKRYRRKPQLVVANADQLAVVIAADAELNLNVVDRYFLAAIQGGLTPMLVVNKYDLNPEIEDSLELREYADRLCSPIYVSALTAYGLSDLLLELEHGITVFCGHSGVGKSTLLSAIMDVELETAEVNPKTGKGRQTTVTSRMYETIAGSLVVDTPGIRVFGLAHLTWLDVHEYFSKIAALAQGCAFRNCLHLHEEGCAVKNAVANGRLSQRRLDSYIKLRGEADEKYWEKQQN